MMKKVFAVILAVLGLAILFIILAGQLSIYLTDHLNAVYLDLYRENATGVSSPWYDTGYHIVDNRFIKEMSRIKEDEKSVISIGSSVCVVPFHDEVAVKDDSYAYRFMTCGNGCYRSDQILYQLLSEENLIGDSDIIKLEISFSTFRDPSVTITETILDKWGKYHVADENGSQGRIIIEKGSGILTPLYVFNTYLIRIQNAWDLLMDYKDQVPGKSHGIGLTERAAQFGVTANGKYDSLIIPGNFRNNYYNPEAVEGSLNISEDMKGIMENLIKDINKEHHLVVELSPMPPNLDNTEFGCEYKDYVDNRLIPFLNESGISYVDYRNDFEQNQYADGVHLGYDAGIEYTNRIMEDINEYAGKITGSF